GQERARRGAARIRARAHRGDRHRGDRTRREGRDPAGRDPRAGEQGGGGGADGQGQPDPPPRGNRGNAFAPQHRPAHGGQPAAAPAQGVGEPGAGGREGRPDRRSRGRGPGPRCPGEQPRAPQGAGGGLSPSKQKGRVRAAFYFYAGASSDVCGGLPRLSQSILLPPMGLAILILGLIVFIGGHALTMTRGARAALIARLGEAPYKIVYSLVAVLAIALIAWAY